MTIEDSRIIPLDQSSLHRRPDDAREDSYFACEFPERPRGDRTMYDFRCNGCTLAAKVSLKRDGDCLQYVYGQSAHDDSPIGRFVPLSRLLRWLEGEDFVL